MMTYGTIPGVDKPVSRVFFGTAIAPMSQGKDCNQLLDAASEMGITAFDTARVYGHSEEVLGKWLKERKNREQVVLLTKCAHYNLITGRNRVTEKDIRKDFEASAKALATDYFDIYLLHRDDKKVDTGEIVELMNELIKEGKIRAYGVSNWSHQRIQQANAYAADHGLVPVTVSSPQYSLARQTRPTARDCITITGPDNADARRFYAESGMAVVSYSSLGSGFLKANGPKELPPCFRCDDNYQRLQRCRELAMQKHCTPSQIALAWLLHSPMNLYPAISTTKPHRLEENLGAFAIQFSQQEWDDLDCQI